MIHMGFPYFQNADKTSNIREFLNLGVFGRFEVFALFTTCTLRIRANMPNWRG